MRNFIVMLWAILQVPSAIFGQFEPIILESERDVVIQRVAKFNLGTALISDRLIYILDDKNQLTDRILLPDSLDKFMFATLNDQQNLVISAFQLDDSIGVVSTWKYDNMLRSLSFVDSINVAASGSLVYFSDMYFLQNGYLAGFSILNQRLTNVGLVKIDETGTIELVAEINNIDHKDHRIFNSIALENLVQLDSSKYFISGFGKPWGIVVDSTLSTLVYLPLWYVNPLDSFQWYDFTNPEIIKLNEAELFVTDHFPDKDAFFQEHMYSTMTFKGDSFSIAPVRFVSNPEQTPKFMINVTLHPDSSIYMTSNMELGGITFRGNRPTDFYLTKLEDREEVWHRVYGDGKHFWRATFVEAIDTCEILITGTVYDYYKKEELSAFYMIVDCDGHILTSNHDIVSWTLELFPNPVEDVLYFKTEPWVDTDVLYELVNSNGSKLRSGMLTSSSMVVSDLPSGCYYIRLSNSHGELLTVNEFVKK